MSLDILVRLGRQSAEWRMCFEDDGYYWFLYPYFEATAETCGQLIDLYGDAEFHAAKGLPQLKANMEKALADAKNLPGLYAVHTGTQIKPVREELYKHLEKGNLIAITGKFLSLIDEVADCDGYLICQGD